MTDLALRHRHGRRRSTADRIMVLIGIAGVVTLAGAPIAYMLWPQPAPVSVDAPALPITVGGVAFNLPPAAIRVAMQRRPGAQARVDLAFVWPSLDPPDLTAKPTPAMPPNLAERLFVTIAASDGTLAPAERFKTIYPRYTAQPETIGSNGLAMRGFRTGTPYQGEELVYDPGAPERFLLRCTHAVSSTPGMCLHERRIAGADVTVRFPRDWLNDWRSVADGIDRLLVKLRPAGG
jgi:hypothetical protein